MHYISIPAYFSKSEVFYMDNKLLIENIRKLCQEHKVSISQLERDLYMSPGLISRWSKNTPTLDRIIDIAEYFGVSLDTIAPVNSTSSNNGKTINQLLTFLYMQSTQADLEWNIFDINNPPYEATFPHTHTPENFFHSDSFYCNINNGYFFFAIEYDSPRIILSLYALADRHSYPELICPDFDKLENLYTYLTKRYGKQLNNMKTNAFIHTVLHDVAASHQEQEPVKIMDIPIVANT